MKTPYAIICDTCYNYIKNGVFLQTNNAKPLFDVEFGEVDVSLQAKCPNCNRLRYFFTVDNNVAPLISVLNKNGYETVYSCQGHSKFSHNKTPDGVEDLGYYYDNPYVVIDLWKSMGKINKELMDIFISHGWSDISIGWINGDSIYGASVLDENQIQSLRQDPSKLYRSWSEAAQHELTNISFHLCEDAILDKMYDIVNYYQSHGVQPQEYGFVSRINKKIDKWFAQNIKELANAIEAINVNEEK